MSGATVHEPGAGERVGGSVSITIKATSGETGGALFLSEIELPAGAPGPPAHSHVALHDMFYVLEGTLTVRVGDDLRPLQAGAFACVPPGIVHTVSNPGDVAVRFLNFSTPGGFETYMRELGSLLARDAPPTPEDMQALVAKYDLELAP